MSKPRFVGPPILRIDYDEGDQSTYRGIILERVNNKGRSSARARVKWHSSDFVKDWLEMVTFCAFHKVIILEASSVNHFFMDGNRYRAERRSGVRTNFDGESYILDGVEIAIDAKPKKRKRKRKNA